MTVHPPPAAATSAPPPDGGSGRGPSRRSVALVASTIVLLLAVGGSGLAAATTLFGPVAFVHVYLDALARGDAAGALALPGVAAGADAPELLTAAGVGAVEVAGVRELGVEAGVHRIQVEWDAETRHGESVLLVERVGTSGLIFPRWGFAVSPTATLVLTAEGDDRLGVNGTALRVAESERYAVFVPGVYRVEHTSRYLSSPELTVLAADTGSELSATVAAEPNDAFREEVAEAVRVYLDGCSAQELLFPTACPFGHRIDDRITSAPEWTIVEYPELPITRERGGWVAGPGTGTARLAVEVQDIADGEHHELDEEVGFRLRLDILLDDDDVLTLTPDGALALD